MTVMEELKKLREITDVLTANGYLVDRTKEWEFVLDAVPALVHIVNTELKIKFVNKAFVESFGGEREDYLDIHCFDIMASDFSFCDENCIKISDAEIDEVYIDRLVGWYHRAKAPIYDDTDTMLGYIVYLQDITERKIAERALNESEATHRNIVESSLAGMHLYELSDKGELIFQGGNPAADAILTVDNSNFIGKTIEEAFPALANTNVPNNYKKVARGGGSWCTIVKYEENGIKGIYEISAFKTARNKMVAMFNDVTKRKEYEQELKKLSSVVEQSQVSVVITNKEGTIEYVNPKFTEVSGYSSKEALGENPRILKADLQTDEFYKEMWDTLSSGKSWRGAFANKRKNGEIYWENAIISPLRLKDNEITHYVAVKEDITERKIAEQKLRESEERFKTAIESTVDLVYERSLPKNGVIWFGDIDAILGYEPNGFERSFDNWVDHVYCKDQQLFNNAASKMTKENPQISVEYRVKHKDGRLLTWVDRGNMIFDDEGNPTKIIGVCKDITTERNYEAELKKAAVNAERKIKNRLSKLVKGKAVYNILLIEDNSDLCELMETYFSKIDGYNIYTASDGMSGLKKAGEILPDALILDIKLPDMDGFDVSKKLNNRFPHMPIIATSGYSIPHDKANALIETGIWSYLSKPIEMSKLRSIIEKTIGVSNMMKENELFKEYLKLKDEIC